MMRPLDGNVDSTINLGGLKTKREIRNLIRRFRDIDKNDLQMKRYMLDTNVFDYILDNKINTDDIKKTGEYFTTNVQLSELANIPDDSLKESLLKIYTELDQKKLLLRSGVWIDELRWDDDQPWVDELEDDFISLSDNSRRRSHMDAHIGAIAIIDELTVVTDDTGFISKCKREGINVLTPDEWKAENEL
jgi:predicted nucleic acid-binding protein